MNATERREVRPVAFLRSTFNIGALNRSRGAMAKRVITLRYAATCRDCGAHLPVGSRARYYGRGKVYGVNCHSDRTAYERGDPGAIASHYDRRGVYSTDGRFLGTLGPRCEDAPCCGCCS